MVWCGLVLSCLVLSCLVPNTLVSVPCPKIPDTDHAPPPPLVACPCPQTKNADVVNRLTDSSKYTGAHANRFDESGKGKGKGGREELVENTGYVSNYKGDGTYKK